MENISGLYFPSPDTRWFPRNPAWRISRTGFPGPDTGQPKSDALPLHQTTFGVSETPDFHTFKIRRESNPDCQRKTSSVRRMRKSSVKERQVWDSSPSPRAAPGARFQSNVLTTRLRVGILIGNQNWSKLSRSGDVQPEIKLPWPVRKLMHEAGVP